MYVGIPKESDALETRVAATPASVKEIVKSGLKVNVESGAGIKSFISDDDYVNAGAKIVDSSDELLKNADIILKVLSPSQNEIDILKENSTIISLCQTTRELEMVKKVTKKSITAFSMHLIPRTTLAQKMDALSSQANIAGYKAVLIAASRLGVYMPLLMTAAGTIRPSKVLILGAGVGGLQAIATANRMGAIVFATDVRMASKEQVESLGGKFLTVDGAENLETEGGYAKEASEDFKKKQEELLSETLKKIDIVICTALIPGKKAPLIVKETMVENMQPGSVIFDLAAAQGGNVAFTEVDKIIERKGIKIIGESNILNKLPTSSSSLYAKNVFNFVSNLYDKENKKININLEDEIIAKTIIK